MNNEKMVINWLKQCQATGVLPWEYDFKQEVFGQKSWTLAFNENPVKRILEKDSGFYGNPSCETEDSMLAQAIYQIVWQTYSKNVIHEVPGDCDADVMNSFWMLFKNFTVNQGGSFFEAAQAIYPRSRFPNKGVFSDEDEKSRRLLAAYQPYGAKKGDTWSSLILKNYETKFKVLDNQNLQKLAKLSHTIGNFTLTPKGFNYTGTDEKHLKHNDSYNTWSEALHNLNELEEWSTNRYLDCSSWDAYCEKFLMADYEKEYAYETKPEQQDVFLEQINTAIENRGKQIIKMLCDQLGYKYLEANDF
ncbi:hypothetical protein [Latilactobacillus fuchuensis]|uniref:hypothetical protein n=1 Tax=Latilactobacillus fuchuensis TaxID=164393 RepID=UPI0039AF6570